MKTNKDKVKELERDAGRWRKKVEDQNKEILRLGREAAELRGGLRELNRAADALCIAVTLKYGTAAGDGAREAVLPEIRVEELLGGYELQTEGVNGEYVFRARRRGETEKA